MTEQQPDPSIEDVVGAIRAMRVTTSVDSRTGSWEITSAAFFESSPARTTAMTWGCSR